MAQTQSSTDEGSGELGLISTYGGTATGARKVVLIKTSCSAVVTATFSAITKATESGFQIADGTPTTETTDHSNDTVQVVHTHTAGATLTVLGAGMVNDDGDVLYMMVCYTASLPMVNGDTLENTLQMKFAASAS